MQRKLLGIISMNLNETGQLLTKYFAFIIYLRKKWEYNEAVHMLFTDFKTAYDSVRREVLYNILTEFGIHMKPVRPINMCLNETYSSGQVGKHMSNMFPFKNGLQQDDVLSPLLSILL
jgi:hypothetical protein